MPVAINMHRTKHLDVAEAWVCNLCAAGQCSEWEDSKPEPCETKVAPQKLSHNTRASLPTHPPCKTRWWISSNLEWYNLKYTRNCNLITENNWYYVAHFWKTFIFHWLSFFTVPADLRQKHYVHSAIVWSLVGAKQYPHASLQGTTTLKQRRHKKESHAYYWEWCSRIRILFIRLHGTILFAGIFYFIFTVWRRLWLLTTYRRISLWIESSVPQKNYK